MSYEHESGLPLAFDRAVGKPDQQSMVFWGDRPFVQSAELNELQTIIRGRHDRLGRLVASDGNRIERAEAVVDREALTVTLTEGSIYVAGDILPVAPAVLTAVPMTGRVEIGVRLSKNWVTHEDDPTLVGMVPGSPAEGEPGAAREVVSIAWAMEGDGGAGEFFSVYTLLEGTVLDQTAPSILDPAMQALAIYDRPNGNYVVSGCRVTSLGINAGDQVFSIEAGEANIFGYKRTRLAAIRHAEPQAWEELAIPGETHIYTGGTSMTFPVDQAPIGTINSILLTKERTVTITRGAVANGADAIPETSVVSVSNVSQGGTTYGSTSWALVAGNIDWAGAGAEPAAGSTYNVTFRWRALVTADEFNNTTFKVSGGATGGDVIIAYTRKLPRIDRLCLQQDGSPIYIKGLPASSNPIPPGVPADTLKLCQVFNDWMSDPVVTNELVLSLTKEQEWRFYNRIVDLDRLVQLERLKSGIDAREPVAKKGMFVDPFLDDTYRDLGATQSGSIGEGMLQLAITPTFFNSTLADPVTLDYVEDVIVSQLLVTGCVKINPYQNFIPLPGALKLTPSVDFWTEEQTQWLSPQTQEFNRGVRTDGGPLETRSTEEQLIDNRVQQLKYLRRIGVAFRISGFAPGEILEALTFDGIDVKPAGTQTANAEGVIAGNFTIPANVTAGSKGVSARGMGGTRASALFTGQGTLEIDVMRRVTTVQTWTQQQLVTMPTNTPNVRPVFEGRGGGSGGGDGGGSDPQAQMFAVPELRQLIGVDVRICAIGDENRGLLIDQVTIDNGYPTTDVVAQVPVSMKNAVVGWKSARYPLPVTTVPEQKHAFVVKTDDANHSISLAKLGGFDASRQQKVTSHPYVTGPRFDSVNAETWTAHQDEALTFRVVAAKYPVTTKTVPLGSFNLVQASDLQVRAAVELPSSGCSVVFEIERPNGTIYKLLPFQVLQLTEFITETVQLRAVLKGTDKLSPILFAPVQLIAGKIDTTLTYISRAMDLGEAVRITAYLKAYLPGGAAITSLSISKDLAGFQTIPLVKTDPLAFPLWTERKYEITNQTGTKVRLRIIATGGPAARLIIGDLGAGIF